VPYISGRAVAFREAYIAKSLKDTLLAMAGWYTKVASENTRRRDGNIRAQKFV